MIFFPNINYRNFLKFPLVVHFPHKTRHFSGYALSTSEDTIVRPTKDQLSHCKNTLKKKAIDCGSGRIWEMYINME